MVLQYDVKAISRMFSGMKFFRRSVHLTCVCIRSINQSNRSISVCLLSLFCLRVFISRSYENRSINTRFKTQDPENHTLFRGTYPFRPISPPFPLPPRAPQMKIYHLPDQLVLRLSDASLKHKKGHTCAVHFSCFLVIVVA